MNQPVTAAQMRLSVQGLSLPGDLLIAELGIKGGSSIVDLALLRPDNWTGFEFKGHGDSFNRFARQRLGYELIFDHVVLIVDASLERQALRAWSPPWGLWIAESTGSHRVVRSATTNPNVSARARLELLWRDEALRWLLEFTPQVLHRQRTRKQLWDALAQHSSEAAIRQHLFGVLERRFLDSPRRLDPPILAQGRAAAADAERRSSAAITNSLESHASTNNTASSQSGCITRPARTPGFE